MKVHADFRLFASTHFDPTKFISSPAYGVERFMLDRIGNEVARATTIVKYQPNSKFPQHTHIGGEEYIVLEGTFHDQYGTFPVGSYVRNPIGTAHAPWVEDDGCTIMVKLLQMTDPEPNTNECKSLHIQLDDNSKKQLGQTTLYGTMVPMYTNQKTGEVVEMWWLNSDAVFPPDDKCICGEEIFVISGSIRFDSNSKNEYTDNDNNNSYSRWGWLRFPPKTNERSWECRPTLIAGSAGAQIYRKTGHLSETARSLEKIQLQDDEETILPTR